MIRQFPDKRTGKNTRYRIEDAALGAFSVFFTQSTSFLVHQTAMTEAKGKSNAQTLFGLQTIPTDNYIHDLLDIVSSQLIFPMFNKVFSVLKELGHLQEFRAVNEQLLIVLDGTEYRSSNKIHCTNCSVTEHKNVQTRYSHTASYSGAGYKRGIPLEPEFIPPAGLSQKAEL